MRLNSSRPHTAHPNDPFVRNKAPMPDFLIPANALPTAPPDAAAGCARQMALHPGQRRRGTFAAAGVSNRQAVRSRRKAFRASQVSLLCGRPALPAEIPRRFSSSLLPPSFAAGRRTTAFTSPRCAARSAAPAKAQR
jgi:hypothetical protein